MESLEIIGEERLSAAQKPEHTDDAELVHFVISGQRDLFRHLVERYQDGVFAMVMRQVGDRGVAEELTQETFIKAYKNLAKFKFQSQFSTWLIRIALNHTSSYFSSRRYKELRRTDRFIQGAHDMSNEIAQREAESNEQIDRLRAALGTFKPIFRDVLVLCGLEGRSYEETAKILEIPIGTVRSRLNKARLLLKEAW